MANKLFIIGNGFDLAHGLPTRYSDFIMWYLKKVAEVVFEKYYYNDDIMEIEVDYSRYTPREPNITDYASFAKYLEKQDIKFNKKSPLLASIVKDLHNKKWVDIESVYYKELLILFHRLDDKARYSVDNTLNEVEKLNNAFNCLKKELIKYLETIDVDAFPINQDIYQKIFEELNACLKQERSHEVLNRVEIIVFNYTSLIEKYVSKLRDNAFSQEGQGIKGVRVNYIHGKLGSDSIIFGYGDEKDPNYQAIEDYNNNEFLRNIKSFDYLLSDRYIELVSFIEQGIDFDVVIMGHSCGISDRLLFNTIVEHQNCKSIKIYYHQKSENENDFYEKTIELSRHFSKDYKKKFREIVIPLNESKPLISWKG